jgi:hypothetical protein
MGELVYIYSGCDKVADLPSQPIEALLTNVPEVLKNRDRILELYRTTPMAKKVLDSKGKQIHLTITGKSKTFTTFISDESKPVVCGKELNLTTTHWKDAVLRGGFTIAMVLDYPVVAVKDPTVQNRIFKKAAAYNIRWAKESLVIRDEFFPETQIFLPFQGFTKKHLDYYRRHLDLDRFDGLSLPTRCFSTEDIIKFLLEFRQIGVKKVHVLGSSRLDLLTVLAFMARNDYFTMISFDSSSTLAAARKGKLLVPYDLGE